ncbi:hypothetical protein F1541_04140 [Haemophilus influenzae biotype aegyptius]|nr:hypothetical protein F1541_04140 [Haemophilus influenzae biotype aegyptius]
MISAIGELQQIMLIIVNGVTANILYSEPIEKDLAGSTPQMKQVKSSTVIDHKDAGSFQAKNSYGVSVIYDFDTEYKIKPYVGARIGVGHVAASGYTKDEFTSKTYIKG